MNPASTSKFASFSPETVRTDFPILQTRVRQNKPLVYLDNAATTQKPLAVINALDDYYRHKNANIHRAVHQLSEQATIAYDHARDAVARFLNASSPAEVIFTRGTTEAINLVAHSYGGSTLKPGDNIVLSYMEHHSNIVPWQIIAERTGAHVQVIPMNQNGDLDLDAAAVLLADNAKILAITQVSNALGTVNPVHDLIRLAHEHGAVVLVDGAQAVQHIPVDVQALDADFYAFSGHKIYGPTGIGVLYGKRELLDKMPPYQGGGDMISSVTFEKSTWNELPSKFEAGTPDIAGAIGLHAALDYFVRFDIAEIADYERKLLDYTVQRLQSLDGVKIIGEPENRAGAVSFIVDGVHPHDIGTFLDREGVAIRTGHHCAQPVMNFYDVPATARASFAMYNTISDIDAFHAALTQTIKIFA